jgi:hypothetical protein
MELLTGQRMKILSTSRITSSRTISAIILLEALTLASFFLSVRVADSYLPELGGSGRASSIYLWNDLANLAFLVLAGLWVASLWLAVRANMANGRSLSQALSHAPQGSSALAVSLPILGLLAGYLLLAL